MHFRRMSGIGATWQRGEIVTHGLDEYRESIDDLWDLELNQLESARDGVRCRFAGDGRAVLYEERFGVAHLQQGSLGGDAIVFALADATARSGRWQGAACPEHSLAYAWSGESIDLMVPAGSRIRVAVLPGEEFESGFATLAGRAAREVFPRGRILLPVPAVNWGRLWRSWGSVIHGGSEAGDLGDRLIAEIAAACGGGGDRRAGDRRAGWSNYRRMVDRLEEGGSLDSAGALALELGISLRSLTEACSGSIGLPPGRFLKLRRLNRIRRDLIRCRADERTVTSLAVEHGFTELGRFAGDYKRLFGELPSETLARRPPRRVERVPGVVG